MKQTKLFLLTCLLTVSAVAALLYSSSCKKDKCKGVVCQNTGTCSGGTCTCPTGYTGAHCENSTITYQNNSFTDLNMTINGTSYVIPAGTSQAFSGTAGSAISVTSIYTQGTYGVPVDWTSFTDYFPTGGDQLTEPFNVLAGYVFVEVQNVSAEPINSLWMDYYWSTKANYPAYIPNNGQTYGIGYFMTSTGTDIRLESGSYIWDFTPAIPNTENAYILLIPN